MTITKTKGLLQTVLLMVLLLTVISLCPKSLLAITEPSGDNIVRVAIGTSLGNFSINIKSGSYIATDLVAQTSFSMSSGDMASFSSQNSIYVNGSVNGNSVSTAGKILIYPVDYESEELNLFTYNGVSYRGGVIIQMINGKLCLINILDVEDYLKGVVPRELGSSNLGDAAYQVQAIISRTYVLQKKTTSTYYEVTAGQTDQSYGGYTCEKSYCTKAVEDTTGQCIYYNGELITPYFSANAGGYTENSENVWNKAIPYLRAVASPYDTYALEYSQDTKNAYTWEISYTLSDFEDKITKWNNTYPTSQINIGSLVSIKCNYVDFDGSTYKATTKANESGRVTQMILTGTKGIYTLNKEKVLTFMGLKSTKFTMTQIGGTPVMNSSGVVESLALAIRECIGRIFGGGTTDINPGEDYYYVQTTTGVEKISKDENSSITGYTIKGYGYGHGVGLSQWGAAGMSKAGYTAYDIIEYYYNQDKNDGNLVIR